MPSTTCCVQLVKHTIMSVMQQTFSLLSESLTILIIDKLASVYYQTFHFVQIHSSKMHLSAVFLFKVFILISTIHVLKEKLFLFLLEKRTMKQDFTNSSKQGILQTDEQLWQFVLKQQTEFRLLALMLQITAIELTEKEHKNESET